MKKIILLMTALLMLTTGCGGDEKTNQNQTQTASAAKAKYFEGKKVLIVYFSKTGENYKVGNIKEGNTKILADMLKDMTGGDSFEIKVAKPYPTEYKETTDIAKQEKADNIRPKIVEPLINVKDYDLILFGYPIWWSDLPMACYTYIEKQNFNGKVVAPFCTHEGSGLGSTPQFISKATNAKVLTGLEMKGTTAQNERETAKAELEKWLQKITNEL